MDNGAGSYRRFLEGDENGIVEIIRDYKDGLTLFLISFTQNIGVAEELMEETFVRLVVKKPSYSARSSFKTWLYTVGRNVAIDYLRRSSKSLPMENADMETLLRDEEDLERAYIRAEDKIALHRALRSLNPEYRQALYLMYFEELRTEEIAAVMKKSKRQVGNLLYRAKLSLKSQLDKEGFEYEGL